MVLVSINNSMKKDNTTISHLGDVYSESICLFFLMQDTTSGAKFSSLFLHAQIFYYELFYIYSNKAG